MIKKRSQNRSQKHQKSIKNRAKIGPRSGPEILLSSRGRQPRSLSDGACPSPKPQGDTPGGYPRRHPRGAPGFPSGPQGFINGLRVFLSICCSLTENHCVALSSFRRESPLMKTTSFFNVRQALHTPWLIACWVLAGCLLGACWLLAGCLLGAC